MEEEEGMGAHKEEDGTKEETMEEEEDGVKVED